MKTRYVPLLMWFILAGCKKEVPPNLASVLTEYIDDVPHLMLSRNIDTVVYILESKVNYPEHWKKNDTTYKLIRTGQRTIVSFSIDEFNNRSNRVLTFDSLGLPLSIVSLRGTTSNVEYIWGIRNNSIYRIASDNQQKHDTTFFYAKNGRVEYRLQKIGSHEMRSAQYSYNKNGNLFSIKDTLLRENVDTYTYHLKEYSWKNNILDQVKEVFNPGYTKITSFDPSGFPESLSIINSVNDTFVFKIKKL